MAIGTRIAPMKNQSQAFRPEFFAHNAQNAPARNAKLPSFV